MTRSGHFLLAAGAGVVIAHAPGDPFPGAVEPKVHRLIPTLPMPVLLRPGGNRQTAQATKALRHRQLFPATPVVYLPLGAFKGAGFGKIVIAA